MNTTLRTRTPHEPPDTRSSGTAHGHTEADEASLPPSVPWSSRLAVGTGAATAGLGLLVALGWLVGVDQLVQIRPSWVPMQFNTAVGLALAGLALVLSARGHDRPARVLGWATVMLGGLTLLQYLTGVNVGIDELVVKARITTETSHPGRMAPNTALAFVLLGSGVVTGLRGRRTWTPTVLFSVTTGLGAVAVFGYLASVPTAYGWGELTAMAMHTALGLIVVGVGGIGLTWSQREDHGDGRWFVGLAVSVLTVVLGTWAAGVALSLEGEATTPRVLAVGMFSVLIVAGAIGLAVAGRVVRHAGRASVSSLVEAPQTGGVTRYAVGALVLVLLAPLLTLAIVVYLQQRDVIVGEALSDLQRALALGTTVPIVLGLGVVGLVGFVLHRSERELRTSRAQLSQVLTTAPVGITFVDSHGVTIYANRRAEQLLRLTQDELPGRYDDPDWRISKIDGSPYPPAQLPVARTLQGEGSVTDDLMRINHPDGSHTDLAVSSAPVEFDDEQAVVVTFRDVTETLEAARTRARLAAIVEDTQDAILSLSHDGTILTWNGGAAHTFGFTAAQALGQNVRLIVPEDRLAELESLHAEVHAGHAVQGVETVRSRADGSRLWVSLTLSPVTDKDGNVVGLSAVERDISEQVRAREQLQRYASELEQFTYVAAHDLQEPLRMVASFTELLARRYQGQLDEEADEFIGFAVEGSKRIQRALNELLAYVNASTGDPFRPVDSARVARAALSALGTKAHRSRAVVTIDDGLPIVLGDERQLLRVFQNLLDNALTYHGDQPPRVRVSARDDGHEWVFSVSDQGIGIDPEHLDQLFGLFRRLHTRLEYPGTGLGLAITKRIVERHGGRVWIDSTPADGTTVYFSLPDQPPQGEPSHD